MINKIGLGIKYLDTSDFFTFKTEYYLYYIKRRIRFQTKILLERFLNNLMIQMHAFRWYLKMSISIFTIFVITGIQCSGIKHYAKRSYIYIFTLHLPCPCIRNWWTVWKFHPGTVVTGWGSASRGLTVIRNNRVCDISHFASPIGNFCTCNSIFVIIFLKGKWVGTLGV